MIHPDLAFIPIIAAGATAIKAGGFVAKAFGKNTNSDPQARSTADQVGAIVRLGAANAITHSWGANAPEAGTFYLALSDGSIYQSKAAGFYLVTKSWATERTALFIQERTGIMPLKTSAPATDWAEKSRSGGKGLLFALIGGIVLWQVLKRVR